MSPVEASARVTRRAVVGAAAADDRLARRVRRGDHGAFVVLWDRHSASILAYATRLLGNRAEAEDVVQHAYAELWRRLTDGDRRPLVVRAWLFQVARNRCMDILREGARVSDQELPARASPAAADVAEHRDELRLLVADVARLPMDQRDALLLAELGDLPHQQVADILGRTPAQVKSLVFRARSSLEASRDARATPCTVIREDLSLLSGGALRRLHIARHLADCPGCREYRTFVRRQRRALRAALPVVPLSRWADNAYAYGVIGHATASRSSSVWKTQTARLALSCLSALGVALCAPGVIKSDGEGFSAVAPSASTDAAAVTLGRHGASRVLKTPGAPEASPRRARRAGHRRPAPAPTAVAAPASPHPPAPEPRHDRPVRDAIDAGAEAPMLIVDARRPTHLEQEPVVHHATDPAAQAVIPPGGSVVTDPGSEPLAIVPAETTSTPTAVTPQPQELPGDPVGRTTAAPCTLGSPTGCAAGEGTDPSRREAGNGAP